MRDGHASDLSDLAEADAAALDEAAVGLLEARGLILGTVDALALVMAARDQADERGVAHRDELRADLARALADRHRWGRVAERAVDRMIVAEARVERARAALRALQQLAARGTPAAREAVGALAAALGEP